MSAPERATARPWICGDAFKHGDAYYYPLGVDRREAEANAALIVRAVNGHAALVRALEGLIAWDIEQGQWEAPCWERARAALRAAGGTGEAP